MWKRRKKVIVSSDYQNTNLQLKHWRLYLHRTVHVEDWVDHIEHLEETEHNYVPKTR